MKAWLIGLLAFLVLPAQAHAAQENVLPADVLNAYAAYEAAVADSDWETAVDAARAAAEAGEHHGIDAASQAVLWENLGIAYLRSSRRISEPHQPDSAFGRALAIHVAQGRDTDVFRLQFRLIQSALTGNDGMLAFERMDRFEAAIATSGADVPDLERQVLAARLSGSRPPSLRGVPPISEGDRARVARLLELATPGSPDYVIAQTRLIYDAVARQAWSEAETLIFETTRAVSSIAPEDEAALEDFIGIFSHVLVEGYEDTETSGAQRWPDDVREVWCGFLDGRAIPTVRIPPRYPPFAMENGWEGGATVHYRVDEFGQFVDIVSAEPIGNTRRALVNNSEPTLRRWQWRPQCTPQAGRTITGQTVLTYEIAG